MRSQQHIGFTKTHQSPRPMQDPYDFETFAALEKRSNASPKPQSASELSDTDSPLPNPQSGNQPVRGRPDMPTPRRIPDKDRHSNKEKRLPLQTSLSRLLAASNTKDGRSPHGKRGLPDRPIVAPSTSESWQLSISHSETLALNAIPGLATPPHRRQQPSQRSLPEHAPATGQPVQIAIGKKRPVAAVCDTPHDYSAKRHRTIDSLDTTPNGLRGQGGTPATQFQPNTTWASRPSLHCDQQDCASEVGNVEPRRFYTRDASGMTPSGMTPSANDMPASILPSRSEPMPRSSRPRGIKHTYGSRRTMLAARAPESANLFNDCLNSCDFDIAIPAASRDHDPFSLDGEAETLPISQPAFQSVHELRRAGANSRFAVEIEDLFERISTPGLSRRNALLEFASGLGSGTFIRRFQDAGTPISFIDELENESDLASCFCLVSAITVLLASTSAARVAGQLREHGITELLARTLSLTHTIEQMRKASKPSLSRDARQSLWLLEARLIRLEVFGMTKAADGGQIAAPALTPQALSLAALQLMAEPCSDQDYVAITSPLADQIFNILDSCPDMATPSAGLALSVLDNWCIKTVSCRKKPCWKTTHTKIAAKLLHMAIKQDSCAFVGMETMVLKLALNITKDNPEASAIIAETGPSEGALIRDIARGTCHKLADLRSSASREESYAKTLGDLILMINLMINIFDRSPKNRDILYQSHTAGDPSLSNMIGTFRRYARSMDNAHTVDQSNSSVALDFLSVLLGYLSLHPSIRQMWTNGQVETHLCLNGMISSIQRLSDVHKQTQGDSSPTGGLSDRLQTLIEELRSAI